MRNTKRPWHTDNWFVSPLNYLHGVTRAFHPPERVIIHDVTLRDGEQQAGVVLTKDDKIRIAEKLAEVGIQRIEAGMPAVSPNDELAIRDIVKRDLGSKIFCFCRCIVDDIKRAADCGVDGVVVEIPSSDHLIKYAYQWPLEKAIDLSIKATRAAKELGLYTVFFPIDATRAKLDWFLRMIERVATEGHMDALGLVDTYGVLSAHGAAYFAKRVKAKLDKLGGKPMEIHFHADFGLGVANTIMAVLAGGEVIHTTVAGIGERAGNTPMEETVLSLLTMYDIDVGIKYNKLCELAELVAGLTGVKIPEGRSFIGDMAYDIETGIPTSWYRRTFEKYPTEIFPVNPAFIGHKLPRILMGKYSGLDNVFHWAEQHSISLSEDEAQAVLARVKQQSHDLKRVLNEEEFQNIVDEIRK